MITLCIIIHKPDGVAFPKEATIKTCLSTHKDGFGAMWREGEKTHILKGLLDLPAIMKLIKLLPKESEVAFHFRMATHGNVTAGNCHPFPLSGKVDALTTVAGKFDSALMHNGIIYGFGDRKSTLSDTMNFVKFLEKATKGVYTYDKIKRCVKDSYGKFLIFTPTFTYTYGTFVEEGGVYYSNTTYKTYNYPCSNFVSGKTKNDNFRKWMDGRRSTIPRVIEVNPMYIDWYGASPHYLGVAGSITRYKGVTIFCEDGFTNEELEMVKDEIDLSLVEDR